MTPFFADINAWTGIGGLVIGAGCLVVAIVVAAKKQATQIYPQPLTVEMVKALHEQFADKKVFEDHVERNTERHSQLFKKIEDAERGSRKEIEKRFAELNQERGRTLEKLNDQFTFIRENISAINRELKIRSEE